MRRRSRTPWFDDFRKRLLFERGAFEAYPDLRPQRQGSGWTNAKYVYAVRIDVPDFEARRVSVSFAAFSEPGFPKIRADGPRQSPHRFDDGRLCVWHPDDEEDRRWVPSDGLVRILDMVALHLFKEAWWRQTGEWLGEEHVHGFAKEAA